ncbi:response regulator transcription factor [Sulfitobacter albidus]|uniref:Response regulator transcription factor n=1 Tax=Sulfitobacter albidus TaxID=2829501 RepID=A0A975PNJ9_9RHOB|nr:response regulator transcription factor [Sulfitobacter albidus]
MKRVLLLEDVRQARDWLGAIVAREFPDAQLTAVGLLRDALEATARETFDLALVDLSLPDGDGTELLRHLAQVQPECHCVVTTVMAADSAIVSALAAGAEGYLLKSDTDQVISHQLHLLMSGIPALSPQIARRIMHHFKLTGPHFEPEAKLTPRETEVLRLIAQGFRVGEAAPELGIAESTVITHIKSIYRKLEVSNRAEATLQASRLGLLGDD